MARLRLLEIAFALVLFWVSSSRGGPLDDIRGPWKREFSEVVFQDVTELDLYLTMVGDLDDVDPESGLTGMFVNLWKWELASRECLSDTWTLITDTLGFKLYALDIRAAQSKPPRWTSMVFSGNLKYLANHEQCTVVTEGAPTLNSPMSAHVCDMYVMPDYFQIGTCVPKTCSTADLNVIINRVLQEYETNWWVFFDCISKAPWTWDSIFVMCILSTFALAVITGTIYDLYISRPAAERQKAYDAETAKVTANEQETNVDKSYGACADDLTPGEKLANENGEKANGAPNGVVIGVVITTAEDTVSSTTQLNKNAEKPKDGILKRVLLSFSFVINGAGVLSAKKPASNLGALNGLRVLSMWWIVWYHCFLFLFDLRVDNPLDLAYGIGGEKWFQIFWQAPYGVDTFFVLSGLLVTYLTLRQLDKSSFGWVDWVLFYVHRYIRLTPVYMVCLGIWSSLLAHFGEGSQKTAVADGSREICRQWWWTNLLYINNLVPHPGNVSMSILSIVEVGGLSGSSSHNTYRELITQYIPGAHVVFCMGWTWYLANDMQFFIFTPIFILLLYKQKRRRIGYIALAAVTAASCIVTAAVSGYWGFTVGNYSEKYNNRTADYPPDADRTYAKPWCRIQAYTVGILVGYLIYSCKGKKFKIPLTWNLTGWILALGTMATVIFAMTGTSSTEPLPQWFAASWLGIHRFLWAAAVGWVGFACVTGNGGPIDVFLSWNLWLPLARLNYCAYLLHPVVIFHYILTKKTMFHYTFYEHVYYFWGALMTTYILSLLITLLVEVPIIALDKAFLRRKRRTE